MFLQGNLQRVFDVLYEMGVIDPVLEMDWQEELQNRGRYEDELGRAVQIVNSHNEATVLKTELEALAPKTLEFLAMEVAREFAEYHSRTELH